MQARQANTGVIDCTMAYLTKKNLRPNGERHFHVKNGHGLMHNVAMGQFVNG